MKIHYTCDRCGSFIDTIEMAEIDENKLGFDSLTAAERQAIIEFDEYTNSMYVQSLCDQCIQILGLDENEGILPTAKLLH